jgi:hypothetical protein
MESRLPPRCGAPWASLLFPFTPGLAFPERNALDLL